jgi:hypothetical protein
MERETERQRSHAAELCVLALVYVSALILSIKMESENGMRDICASDGRCVNFSQKKINFRCILKIYSENKRNSREREWRVSEIREGERQRERKRDREGEKGVYNEKEKRKKEKEGETKKTKERKKERERNCVFNLKI